MPSHERLHNVVLSSNLQILGPSNSITPAVTTTTAILRYKQGKGTGRDRKVTGKVTVGGKREGEKQGTAEKNHTYETSLEYTYNIKELGGRFVFKQIKN